MHVLLGFRRLLVIKMVHDSSHLQSLLPNASKMQAIGKLGILMSPFQQILILTIYLDGILSPISHVATSEMVDSTSIAKSQQSAEHMRTEAVAYITERHVPKIHIDYLCIQNLFGNLGR